MQSDIRVGLFGIGLEAYWPQFEGLRDRLAGYQSRVAERLRACGVGVVDAGMVDSPNKAGAAASRFRQEEVELIFLYVSTYALSSTVLPVIQKANVPVVVLNLQPVSRIDYQTFNALGDRTKMTGEWLAHCQACSVPEIANVFKRARIPFRQVTGIVDDDPVAWSTIEDWIAAARVAHTMANNRVGLMGHYYNGMLDIYSDPTQHAAQFGCHIEHIEMSELLALRREASDSEIDQKVSEIHEHFQVEDDCTPEEIRRAASTAVALDQLVVSHELGSLAYFYEGTGDDAYVDLISSVIVGNSMLTARGIPVAGEYELKNVQAMKIMDSFGAGGSFTEFYAMDFDDDIVLMGHDGPGHTAIAEGKTRLKPLYVYHGKVGSGLSVEMSVRHGPVTLLSVIDEPDGRLKLLVAEGESVAGPILEIGNTNSRYRFSIGVRAFVDQWCAAGPAHHCAVGVGHIADRVTRFGDLIGLETIRVC